MLTHFQEPEPTTDKPPQAFPTIPTFTFIAAPTPAPQTTPASFIFQWPTTPAPRIELPTPAPAPQTPSPPLLPQALPTPAPTVEILTTPRPFLTRVQLPDETPTYMQQYNTNMQLSAEQPDVLQEVQQVSMPMPPPLGYESTNIQLPSKFIPNSRALGETCDYHEHCPNEAMCIQRICVCRPGFVVDNNQCVDAAFLPSTALSLASRKLGELCVTEDECPMSSDCTAGVCVCSAEHVAQDGRCIAEAMTRGLVPPGHSCLNGEVCLGGSICDFDAKTCKCAAGHHDLNGKCTSNDGNPFVLPGESCARGEQCAGASVCVEGTCVCEPDHHNQDGYCRPIAAPNADVTIVEGTGLRFKTKINNQRPLATVCDPARCQLPYCFCSPTGKTPPGGLLPHETPQFVVLTFDDAVNGRTMPDYKDLFEEVKFKNPNGCPIKGTFFVSHEWTNYDSVQWIFHKGHELASNSITHVSLEGKTAQRWLNEMDGLRRIMAKFANANEEEIVGMRAPQLAVGGDEMAEMMVKAGFLYDNSMTANGGLNGEPFWPQTMDYKMAWPCFDHNCPTKSFPGIWEIPLNQFYGKYLPQIDSYQRSSMLRAAVSLNASADSLFEMLQQNLQKAYSTNRAPLILTLNADFLQLNERHTGYAALERFLEANSNNPNIYFVTLKQLITWMQEPVPLSRIHESPAVRCRIGFNHHPTNRSPCPKPNKCMYKTPGLSSTEHQFLTCSPCPPLYPWMANPTGVL